MNIRKTLTIFIMTLLGAQIAAMQQSNLRQQLIAAAYRGNNERVEQLMLVGAPVTPQALWYLTQKGNYDIVKTVFECGADPESPAGPNLFLGSTTVFMHLLLNQKLQPQVKEKFILLYLKHGADIELRNRSGLIMLNFAAHNLDFNTLKLLLEHGAYANAQDDCGNTALMELAYQSTGLTQVKKAKLLIQHGADVNLTDEIGATCLMMAVCLGNKTFVEFLLENDAIVSLKDQKGKSALDYAKYKPEILKLLEDAQKTTCKKSQDSQSDPTEKIINNRET